MAPIKTILTEAKGRTVGGITTRSQAAIGTKLKADVSKKEIYGKRKAVVELKKDVKQARSVLGDITNVCKKTDDTENGTKKNELKKINSTIASRIQKFEAKASKTVLPARVISSIPTKITTKRSLQKVQTISGQTGSNDVTSIKSEDSLNDEDTKYEVPEGVVDFDKENINDIFQAPDYAMDIFNYLKSRESHFKIHDYMQKQTHINIHMRALLVDWMVEVQESFELNHETLYLAIKLVDTYLNKVEIVKDRLQLVGATSLFIASKFDERMPPMIDDFVYICDSAYNKEQMLKMEKNVLKACNFEMGIPLSYRFLRRYARCAKVQMPTLTLARFILEYSLMDYTTITQSDSKLAAAALYIALRMNKIGSWTKTLEYYSGYKLTDIMPQVQLLNNFLHKTPKDSLVTIRNKYSHKIFFEVAKIPLIQL